MPLNHAVMYKSQSVEWPTDRAVYDKLNEEFGFDFDPCPLGGDADGTSSLFCSWRNKRVFCNPPYGPGIRPFLERWHEAQLAVYLIPARVDTRWFHEIVLPNATEVRFIRGRLRFGDLKWPAPFPSMLCVFDNSRYC